MIVRFNMEVQQVGGNEGVDGSDTQYTRQEPYHGRTALPRVKMTWSFLLVYRPLIRIRESERETILPFSYKKWSNISINLAISGTYVCMLDEGKITQFRDKKKPNQSISRRQFPLTCVHGLVEEHAEGSEAPHPSGNLTVESRAVEPDLDPWEE